MKFIKYITAAVLFCSAMSSCEDMLETKLTNEWDDEDTWTNPNMAQGVLMNAYKGMMVWPDGYGNNFLDAATDNALTRDFTSQVYRVSMGALSRSTNPIGNWTSCYNYLQYVHQFLEKGLTDDVMYNRSDPEVDALIKKRLEGEAYFLRAWYRFLLLQMYGGRTDDGQVLGYTIVTRYIDPEEAAQPGKFVRNTYEECVEQIIRDCEKAHSLLPLVYTGDNVVTGINLDGRASGLAALALKSRVLNYAASPAYQPPSVVRIDGMGEYTVLDDAAYRAKWVRAAEFAGEVLDLPEMAQFTTYTSDDISDATENAVSELILRTLVGVNNDLEERNFPPYYLGHARTIPSENLAESFPASNGFPIADSRSGYDKDDPYDIERDRRFYLNIIYHGSIFGGDDEHPIDVSENGKDGPNFHIYASRSGYYLAKFVNTKIYNRLYPAEDVGQPRHYNPLLRRTEIWLNYAEAANKAWGPTVAGGSSPRTAYEVVRTVRDISGGINDVTYLNEMSASRDSFRELIQNERRIEFAFENHRFWDMRRWLMKLDTPVKGMAVRRTASGFAYTVENIEERKYDDIRFYYLPLPYSEISKNPDMPNNMGWDN